MKTAIAAILALTAINVADAAEATKTAKPQAQHEAVPLPKSKPPEATHVTPAPKHHHHSFFYRMFHEHKK